MKKILLIEDDDMLRQNIAELLTLSNYEVLSAPNGVEGIQIAQNTTPDIIVCDIMMSPINGYEVLEKLSKHQNTSLIPFIFLTAKSEYKDIRQGMNLGADDYLVKPFTEEDLLETIEKRLEKFEKQKENYNNLNDAKIDPFDLFIQHAKLIKLRKNDILTNIDSKYSAIYLIKKGLVKSYNLDTNGKILGLYFYKENNFIGSLSPHDKYSQNNIQAVCIKDTELYKLEKDEISKLLDDNPNLAKEFISYLSKYINDILDQFMPIAYGNAATKTISTLIRLYDIFCYKETCYINLSRNDIANFAGLSTETLIRELKKLKAKSLIEIRKRKIFILNISNLQQELQSQ